jgi:hypothetical protein
MREGRDDWHITSWKRETRLAEESERILQADIKVEKGWVFHWRITSTTCCKNMKEGDVTLQGRSESQATSSRKGTDSWALLAHACNPSYSGGRDQEDWGSKPVPVNSLRHPVLKKNITHKKMTDGVAQGVGPEFKPQYHKKKKRNR